MIRVPGKVIAATTLVAVLPAAAVWGLRADGVLTSFVASAALGAALSLAACQLAAWLWQRRPGSEDVLFGDLMIWGWIRRCAAQRRLADAESLLGLRRAGGRSQAMALSVERRVALLEQLATDLETRDPYTHGHSHRVARYAGMIAKRLGVSGEELARIRTAAAVHDVGKLDTPIEILHKPGRLTDEEFEVVKQHPVTGAQMVSILEDEQLAAIVRHHHERLDGTGYPDRLAGTEIPLGARIISVADTFDAITSARSYRAAKPHRQAIEILRAEAGTQLDRDAVNAFCSVYLGRRPLGLWVAFTDFCERLASWFAPDALSSGARAVALAATTAAVGGGVAALPASARRTSDAQRSVIQAHSTRTAVAGIEATRRPVAGLRAAGSTAPSRARNRVRVRVTSRAGAGGRAGAAPLRPVTGPGGAGVTAAAPGGSGSGPSDGAGLAATVSTDGTAAGGTGANVGVGAGHGGGVHLSVGGGSGGAAGGVGVTVSGSSGTTNVGVSVGGSSGLNAGVTLGSAAGQGSSTPSVALGLGGSSGSDATAGSGSGINATVSVPGVASIKLHLG